MTKEIISTQKAPEAIGPYSQGIKAGNLILTSGQLPVNPQAGELVSDIELATQQSIENIKAIVEQAGSSLDKVIKTVVFLKDLNDFTKMNAVYEKYFSANSPARSTVQVAKLPKDAVIEIEAIALTNPILLSPHPHIELTNILCLRVWTHKKARAGNLSGEKLTERCV